jgi:hypothetical protein
MSPARAWLSFPAACESTTGNRYSDFESTMQSRSGSSQQPKTPAVWRYFEILKCPRVEV